MKTAIIDLDGCCFVIGHPNKQLDLDGKPMRTEDNSKFLYIDKTEEELAISADTLMESILTKGGFDSYIGYIKGSKTISDRLDHNPDYKQNRSKEQPKWWPFVKDYLISKWNAIPVNDMEVDDMVSIISKTSDKYHIVAVDKDLLGLEGTHYNWNKNEWVTRTKEEADYRFWSSMICGDTVDNIKGIPKKGEAFVKKLFLATKLSYRSSVMNEYKLYFKDEWKKDFKMNYMCLKIKDVAEGEIRYYSPFKFERKLTEESKDLYEQTERVDW